MQQQSQQRTKNKNLYEMRVILIGCQGVQAYQMVLTEALEHGLSPVMVKEVVYQAADYMGLGRMLPFLTATNEILNRRESPFHCLHRQPPRRRTAEKRELRHR